MYDTSTGYGLLLERHKGFIGSKLQHDLRGLYAVGHTPRHHEGLPLLVFQHLALIQDLHSLLAYLATAAVELVAVQDTQLQQVKLELSWVEFQLSWDKYKLSWIELGSVELDTS